MAVINHDLTINLIHITYKYTFGVDRLKRCVGQVRDDGLSVRVLHAIVNFREVGQELVELLLELWELERRGGSSRWLNHSSCGVEECTSSGVVGHGRCGDVEAKGRGHSQQVHDLLRLKMKRILLQRK
jgi:hypothetical protein